MIFPVSRQSWYALDCLNFLVASVQTGLGTFVAFYLASLGWSKESVGLALASGGSYFAKNAIFFATAALCVPALVALSFIKPNEIDYCRARNAVPGEGAKPQTVRTLVRNRTLLYFVLCLVLFQFADASGLPLLSQNFGTSKAESIPVPKARPT
jgi:hypothetical protein